MVIQEYLSTCCAVRKISLLCVCGGICDGVRLLLQLTLFSSVLPRTAFKSGAYRIRGDADLVNKYELCLINEYI